MTDNTTPNHESWTRDREEEEALRSNNRRLSNADDLVVWSNIEAPEAILIAPRQADSTGIPSFVAKHYCSRKPNHHPINSASRIVNSAILFRDNSPEDICTRLQPWLQQTTDAEALDLEGPLPDRSLSPDKIKRSELKHVTSLEDWAYLVGADFHMSEKIGNTKQSDGSVAYFSGSHRRGEGAYVAQASEHGPRGKQYYSIGTEPNGYYKIQGTSTHRRGAVDLFSPKVSFDGAEITIKTNTQTVTVVATTGMPDEFVGDEK
jgi:hypothetical protein